MSYLISSLVILLSLAGGWFVRDQIPADLSFGAPSTALTYQKTLIPVSDNAYDLGTTTQRWRNLYVSGTCTGCGSSSGSVSTSTTPTISHLAYWGTSGATPELLNSVATTTLTATSTLSLSQAVVKVGGTNSVLTLATSTLFGVGTPGYVLAMVDGTHQWVATTTFSGGLAFSAGNVTNTLTAGDGLTRNTDDFDLD